MNCKIKALALIVALVLAVTILLPDGSNIVLADTTTTPTVTPAATTQVVVPKTFPDVNADNFVWAQESVEYLAGLGIINGSVVDGQLLYLPANTITRAELCKLIVAAYGFTQDGQATAFADVEGHWAINYIAVASSQGIVKGYEDNTFKPDSGISREELAVMISRAMSKKNVGIQITDNEIEQNLVIFLDSGMIDTWARKDVAFAVFNGIIKGNPVDGGFDFLPLDTANRAETAVMIKRAYDKPINTVNPTSTPTPESTVNPTSTPTPVSTVNPTSTPTPESTVNPTRTPTPESTVIPTSTPTPESTVTPTSTPTHAITVNVSIAGYRFSPQIITINKGDTVIWTNNDPTGHDVNGTEFVSQTLFKGQTYSFTFSNSGTFNYVCDFHSGMTGQVIVI